MHDDDDNGNEPFVYVFQWDIYNQDIGMNIFIKP